jgi:hypothetical protein
VRLEIAPVLLPRSRPLTLSVEYEGGIGIVPTTPQPQPGERTSSLKILDVQSDRQNLDCQLRLTLAGIGGRTYPLRVITSLPNLRATFPQTSRLQAQKTETGYAIDVPFEGSGYVTRQGCLSNSAHEGSPD